MKRTGTLGLFFILCTVWLCAQDIEVKRERVFTGAGLYGFMNGGADLFMEYDVYLLTNRDIVYNGENFTIDIYELPTPEDAFGIYSMHVFRCQRADSAGCTDCLSPYQLQAVVNNKYVSLVFPSGSSSAQQLADEVIRHYLPEGSAFPAFPQELAEKPPYSGVLKYVRGPISASGVSKDLSVRVKEIAYKGIWIYSEKEKETYHAYILLDNQEAKELKKSIPLSDILKEGNGFIHIRGKEKEEEVIDFGPFGF